MKRIKRLSLVVTATLALSAAVGAASASAAFFELESSPATVGSSAPYGDQQWIFNAGATWCVPPKLSGEVYTHASSLQPTVQSGAACSAVNIGKEIKNNACSFRYKPGARTGAATFQGTVDIVCPIGVSMEITGGSASACKIAVPEQTGLPATYENIGSGKERAVKVTVATTSLKYSQISGSSCTVGSYTNGTWEGSWKISTSNGLGSVGMWLGFPSMGIIGTPPQLMASYYPLKITGSQGTQHVITMQGGTVKCSTANLSTSASGATATLSVQAEYSGCTALGFPGAVNMNGCTYTFNILNQAPIGSAHPGHADIACPEGKSIVVTAVSAGLTKCTVTIPAQTTDSEGLMFTNDSSIPSISLDLNVKGIDYHQQEGSGLGRCKTLDATDGTYTGSSTLIGGY